MKKILVLLDSNLNRYPPVLALLDSIRGECDVTVIAGEYSPEIDALYSPEKQMRFIHLYHEPFQGNIFFKAYDRIKRILTYRNSVKKYLRENDPDLIWVATAETALHLGNNILKGRPFILNMFELYDRFPRRLARLKKTAHDAVKIVCPEENRANILRVWWKLDRTPTVIPNKPTNHPLTPGMPLDGIPGEVVSGTDKKIILYQGHITPDRRLDALCEAVSALPDYCIVLMGRKTDYFRQLKEKFPFILHQDFVSPPLHLNITSHAHIGIVTYTYFSLNTIFCAPNKIWEYSGFGIPMLGNDIPGLSSTIGTFEAGICANMDDPQEITEAIRAIGHRYEHYSQNARRMYDSVDISEKYKSLLS